MEDDESFTARDGQQGSLARLADIARQVPDSDLAHFHAELHPKDMYDGQGTYFADLPLRQRTAFIWASETAELRAEWAYWWRATKKCLWAPVGHYWRHYVRIGAGMLLEGYTIFSIGILEGLFDRVWPQCWGKEATRCKDFGHRGVTGLEMGGIMAGQLFVGVRLFRLLIKHPPQATGWTRS